MTFFCSVLLAWVLTNVLLGAAITFTNSKASAGVAHKAVNGYMALLLASVAGLACEFFFLFFILPSASSVFFCAFFIRFVDSFRANSFTL
jgi:hypothetical protein